MLFSLIMLTISFRNKFNLKVGIRHAVSLLVCLSMAASIWPVMAVAAIPSAISLNSSVAANSIVAYNTPITFTGKIEPGHEATVTVQFKKLGAKQFTTLAQVQSDAAGNYTSTVAATAGGSYQVSWPGDADHDTAVSSSIYIGAQGQITLDKLPKPNYAGEVFYISGTLTPAHKNTLVGVQTNNKTSWKTIARARTDKKSKFRIKVSISKTGVYRLRVVFSDTDHAQTSSEGFNVKLKWGNPWKLSAAYPEYVVVSKKTFKLWFLRKGKVVRVFRAGVGMPSYPTPSGNWKVVRKGVRPTWYRPGSDWAKNMPESIPWPGSPLGERGLYLSAPGIIIHGTTQPSLLDRSYRAVSHGCIRLKNPWVIWLYSRVPVGTPVKIYG